MTYHVTVERDGRFWLVTIDGVGMTQTRNLDEVEEMARDYISLAEEVDEGSIIFTLGTREPRRGGGRSSVGGSRRGGIVTRWWSPPR